MWIEISGCTLCLSLEREPCAKFVKAMKKVDGGQISRAQCVSYDYEKGDNGPRKFRTGKKQGKQSPPPEPR